MAITVSSTPFDVSLVRNPVAFKFASDNYVITPGVNASLRIEQLGNIPLGSTFTLAWGDNSVTFTSAAAPDNSGTQVTSVGTPNQLGVDIASNYLVASDFIITNDFVGSDFTILTARNAGTDYTLTFTAGTSGLTEAANTAGVDEAVQENFKILAELWVEEIWDGGTYTKAITKLLDVNESGEATFRVEEVLESYFNKHNLPTFNGGAMQAMGDATRRFYIRYAERYGSTPATYAMHSSNVYVAMNGGVNFTWMPYNLVTEMANTNGFLTWRGYPWQAVKQTVNEPAFIYYLARQAYTQITVKLVVTFSNGTTQDVNPKLTYLSPQKYNVISIPTGYTQLGIAAVNPALEPVSYTLQVLDDVGGILTVEHEVLVDRKQHAAENYFMFKNSYGLFEVMNLHGFVDDDLKVTRQDTVNLEQPYYYNDFYNKAAVRKTHTVETVRALKLNSGYMTKKQAQYYRELLSSDIIWQADPDVGYYIPFKMVSNSFNIIPGGDETYKFTLQVEEAFYRKGFGPNDFL